MPSPGLRSLTDSKATKGSSESKKGLVANMGSHKKNLAASPASSRPAAHIALCPPKLHRAAIEKRKQSSATVATTKLPRR